jgi:hypothetical protein
MATPEEHFVRYGRLRARLLAQHFAYSRHSRVNFLSLWNWLLDPPPGLGATAAERDELKRWNVIVHGRENPLAYSAHLVAFLSAEHALGHDKARPIVDLALDAFAKLYKFDGDFAGYPTRWDARTSAQDEGVEPLDRARDFLVGPDGQYLYSIPSTDPRHVPLRSPSHLRALKTTRQADEYETRWSRYKNCYRSPELSMDELAGLAGAYAIAFRLIDVPGTRSKIRSQVNKLGDYLASCGYLLVRPAGGFAARGATGVLPAYEYPMVNAFLDITGTDFASRIDFMAALDQAGYLAMLRAPILEFQVGGIAALATGIPQALVAGTLGLVQAVAGILGIPVTGPLVVEGAGLGQVLNQIADKIGVQNVFRALALYVHSDCFDVWDDDTAGEIALASVLKEFPRPERFGLYTSGLSLGIGGNSVSHLPALALSAVDGTDTIVGDSFREVVRGWRAAPPAKQAFLEVSESPFTSALALLHADAASKAERMAEEAKLVQLLDATYDSMGDDLPMEANTEHADLGASERTNAVDPGGHVLNYLAAVALAWLYEKRRRDAGTPVETDRFPVAPDPSRFREWPAPTIPGYAINGLQHVRRAVTVLPPAPGPVRDDEMIDLFSARVSTKGMPPLHPVLPTPTVNFLGEVQITVREGDRDVYTGIDLQDNDEFAISATGQIRGAPLAGLSGPDGWAQVADHPGWPLHAGLDPSARKFALLGSLGGYFLVGSNFPRTRFLYPEVLPLYLRINDSAPGDGAGEFEVTIKLWGAPGPNPIWRPGSEVSCVLREPGTRRIAGLGGDNPDGSSWRLPLNVAIRFIDGGHIFRVGQASVGVSQTGGGQLYLRTTRNKLRQDNLGRLPACSP